MAYYETSTCSGKMTVPIVSGYSVRAATASDLDVLVRHRLHMFREMGTTVDDAVDGAAFRLWFDRSMASGEYRAWLVVTDIGEVVAGGCLAFSRGRRHQATKPVPCHSSTTSTPSQVTGGAGWRDS